VPPALFLLSILVHPRIKTCLHRFFHFPDRIPYALVFFEDAELFLGFNDVVEFFREDFVHDLVVFVVVLAVEFCLHVPVAEAVHHEEGLRDALEEFRELLARVGVDVFELEQYQVPVVVELAHIEQWLESHDDPVLDEIVNVVRDGADAGLEFPCELLVRDAGVAGEFLQYLVVKVLQLDGLVKPDAHVGLNQHFARFRKHRIGQLPGVHAYEHAVINDFVLKDARDLAEHELELVRVSCINADNEVVAAGSGAEPVDVRKPADALNQFLLVLLSHVLEVQADVEDAVIELFEVDEREKALDNAVVEKPLDPVADDLLGKTDLFCYLRIRLACILVEFSKDFLVLQVYVQAPPSPSPLLFCNVLETYKAFRNFTKNRAITFYIYQTPYQQVFTVMSILTVEQDQARVTNIKVPKEIADLARIYCIFNNKTLRDFTASLLEKELEDFRKQLNAMKRLKDVS
jgi:hypothetical protein